MDEMDATQIINDARQKRDEAQELAEAMIVDRDVARRLGRASHRALIEARREVSSLIDEIAEQVAVVNQIAGERDAARQALLEIGQLALAYHADTRQEIIGLVQGVIGTIISRAPYGAGLGAATAAMVRDDQIRRDRAPTQAEMEAFWLDEPVTAPPGNTKVTIKLRTGATTHSEHEMHGPSVGIPTRGAAWVWVSAEPGPTTEACAKIERLTTAIEAAARALETEES